MTKLEQWLNSGIYVFVVLSEQGYQDNKAAREKWPDAVSYGDYRLVNFHKDSAEYFLEYLDGLGYEANYGIIESTPMLLTWDEAIQFAAQFTTKEPATAWPP
jgi:hypothetical protein